MDIQLTVATIAWLASSLQERVDFVVQSISDGDTIGEELYRARTFLGDAIRALNNANEGSRYPSAMILED